MSTLYMPGEPQFNN